MTQGMSAAQLIAAVGDHQRDRLTPCRTYEEREEVASRSISPMKVLHDEYQRLLSGGGGKHRQQLLEKARLRTLPHRRACHTRAAERQLRQKSRQLLARGAEDHFEPGPIPLGDERAQRPNDGRIRKLPTAERQTLANHDRHPVALTASGELSDQPALADTRLPADEHDRAEPF